MIRPYIPGYIIGKCFLENGEINLVHELSALIFVNLMQKGCDN